VDNNLIRNFLLNIHINEFKKDHFQLAPSK